MENKQTERSEIRGQKSEEIIPYSRRRVYLPNVETLLEPVKLDGRNYVKRAMLPSGSRYLIDENGAYRSAKREAKRRKLNGGKTDAGSG
jgi:hypothetical protein